MSRMQECSIKDCSRKGRILQTHAREARPYDCQVQLLGDSYHKQKVGEQILQF